MDGVNALGKVEGKKPDYVLCLGAKNISEWWM